MTTFLYARVSTAEQTLDHQLTQARQAGHHIEDEHVIADHGVSGVATKLCERPEGRRLFDLLRKGDTLVVRWVDRLLLDRRTELSGTAVADQQGKAAAVAVSALRRVS